MNAPARLALFALAAAAAFGLGLGVGDAVGPWAESPTEQHAPGHDVSPNPTPVHDSTEEQP